MVPVAQLSSNRWQKQSHHRPENQRESQKPVQEQDFTPNTHTMEPI